MVQQEIAAIAPDEEALTCYGYKQTEFPRSLVGLGILIFNEIADIEFENPNI